MKVVCVTAALLGGPGRVARATRPATQNNNNTNTYI